MFVQFGEILPWPAKVLVDYTRVYILKGCQGVNLTFSPRSRLQRAPGGSWSGRTAQIS